MKNTYWNNAGKYEELYHSYAKKLIPSEGKSETEEGEMLRCAANVYYDVYNNGGCNLDCTLSEQLSYFINTLNKLKFENVRILTNFFDNFMDIVTVDSFGFEITLAGNGYSDFDSLFTAEVEETLENAVNTIIEEIMRRDK